VDTSVNPVGFERMDRYRGGRTMALILETEQVRYEGSINERTCGIVCRILALDSEWKAVESIRIWFYQNRWLLNRTRWPWRFQIGRSKRRWVDSPSLQRPLTRNGRKLVNGARGGNKDAA
jgi:hypothetical protein